MKIGFIPTLLAITLTTSGAFAQTPNAQGPVKEALSKRLEIEGLRLLIETKMLDDKLPEATGIPKEVWNAGSSEHSSGITLGILGVAAFLGSADSALESFRRDDPFNNDSSLSVVLAVASIGAFTYAGDSMDAGDYEHSQSKKAAIEQIRHDIDVAVDKTSTQMAAIFSLSSQDQIDLKEALLNEAAKQLEKRSSIWAGKNDGIKVDSLEVMFKKGMITSPTYKAAKDIREFLAHEPKKPSPRRASLIYGEHQVQNMITYLEDLNTKIEDRDVNSHISALVLESQRELDFIKSQAH